MLAEAAREKSACCRAGGLGVCCTEQVARSSGRWAGAQETSPQAWPCCVTLHGALFAVLLLLALSRDAFARAAGSISTKESWPLGCPVSVWERAPGSSPRASPSSWGEEPFGLLESIPVPADWAQGSQMGYFGR